jgi:hypothetical protein
VILLDAFKEKDNTKFLQIRSHSRVAWLYMKFLAIICECPF